MAFLIGSFIFLKNVILLDLKSFINVDTQKHWFSSIISSSSLLSPFLFIESHVRSFSFTPTLTVISLIIALYFLLGGLLVIVRCWRPYKLYSKWSHWLSYQYKQQHQLSNRNNRLIIYFLQLQVARLQILTRCMCQSGISHLLISYPYIVDAIHTFQPYENNRLSSFFYYSNNIYPILYIISTWFLLHSLWSLISVEIQSLKGYSSAEEFIIKNINDFLRKDKIPVSITELDNIYTLESVFHILQSCQHRTLLRSSGSEQEGGSSSSSSNRRINLSNYLQYLALPTFSTKVYTFILVHIYI